jgi:hypothetical protein
MSTRAEPAFESIGRRCYQAREYLEDVPAAVAAAAQLLVEEAAWLQIDQGDFKPPMNHRRFCAIVALMGAAADALRDKAEAILSELPEITTGRGGKRDPALAEEMEL